VTNGPALTKGADLVGILTKLNVGDVLLIDEIHRLSPCRNRMRSSCPSEPALRPHGDIPQARPFARSARHRLGLLTGRCAAVRGISMNHVIPRQGPRACGISSMKNIANIELGEDADESAALGRGRAVVHMKLRALSIGDHVRQRGFCPSPAGRARACDRQVLARPGGFNGRCESFRISDSWPIKLAKSKWPKRVVSRSSSSPADPEPTMRSRAIK